MPAATATSRGLRPMTHESSASPPEDPRTLLAELLRARSSRPDQVPLSEGQRRLWDLRELDPTSPVYNFAIAYRLDGPLDVPALTRAVAIVAGRHEALRARFSVLGGRPVMSADA